MGNINIEELLRTWALNWVKDLSRGHAQHTQLSWDKTIQFYDGPNQIQQLTLKTSDLNNNSSQPLKAYQDTSPSASDLAALTQSAQCDAHLDKTITHPQLQSLPVAIDNLSFDFSLASHHKASRLTQPLVNNASANLSKKTPADQHATLLIQRRYAEKNLHAKLAGNVFIESTAEILPGKKYSASARPNTRWKISIHTVFEDLKNVLHLSKGLSNQQRRQLDCITVDASGVWLPLTFQVSLPVSVELQYLSQSQHSKQFDEARSQLLSRYQAHLKRMHAPHNYQPLAKEAPILNTEQPRQWLLYGDHGSGKTTLCQQLIAQTDKVCFYIDMAGIPVNSDDNLSELLIKHCFSPLDWQHEKAMLGEELWQQTFEDLLKSGQAIVLLDNFLPEQASSHCGPAIDKLLGAKHLRVVLRNQQDHTHPRLNRFTQFKVNGFTAQSLNAYITTALTKRPDQNKSVIRQLHALPGIQQLCLQPAMAKLLCRAEQMWAFNITSPNPASLINQLLYQLLENYYLQHSALHGRPYNDHDRFEHYRLAGLAFGFYERYAFATLFNTTVQSQPAEAQQAADQVASFISGKPDHRTLPQAVIHFFAAHYVAKAVQHINGSHSDRRLPTISDEFEWNGHSHAHTDKALAPAVKACLKQLRNSHFAASILPMISALLTEPDVKAFSTFLNLCFEADTNAEHLPLLEACLVTLNPRQHDRIDRKALFKKVRSMAGKNPVRSQLTGLKLCQGLFGDLLTAQAQAQPQSLSTSKKLLVWPDASLRNIEPYSLRNMQQIIQRLPLSPDSAVVVLQARQFQYANQASHDELSLCLNLRARQTRQNTLLLPLQIEAMPPWAFLTYKLDPETKHITSVCYHSPDNQRIPKQLIEFHDTKWPGIEISSLRCRTPANYHSRASGVWVAEYIRAAITGTNFKGRSLDLKALHDEQNKHTADVKNMSKATLL